jgi:hypothetical protein
MSPKAAATLEFGADPKRPPKNLVMNNEAGPLLTAVPIEKTPKQNVAGSMDIFLPQSSLTGPQNRGPNAKPNT